MAVVWMLKSKGKKGSEKKKKKRDAERWHVGMCDNKMLGVFIITLAPSSCSSVQLCYPWRIWVDALSCFLSHPAPLQYLLLVLHKICLERRCERKERKKLPMCFSIWSDLEWELLLCWFSDQSWHILYMYFLLTYSTLMKTFLLTPFIFWLCVMVCSTAFALFHLM